MTTSQQIANLIERLPDDQREVVRLRHETGWKLQAICRQRNESPAAVAAILLAAAQRLSAELAEGAQE